MKLDVLFACGGIALELILVLLQLQRRSFRLLPVFFAYVCWSLLSDVVTCWASLQFSPRIYLQIYLVQLSIDSGMVFLVLSEIAWSILRPIRLSLSRLIIPLIMVMICLAALLFWPLTKDMVPTHLNHTGIFLFRLEQTSAILRIFVFLVLTSFSHLLRITWRNREMQLASGLGIYSLISIAVLFIHSRQYVGPSYHWLDLLSTFSYLGVLFYWNLCFAQKEAEREQFSPRMQSIMLTLAGTAHGELDRLRSRKD